MYSRGIRGAITLENDSTQEVEKATIELFSKILKENDIEITDISHVIFTTTKDITSAFPAKFIRAHYDAKYLPMMCFNEMDVDQSLKMCLRALVVVNTEKTQEEINHIYLGGAKALRADLSK